MTNFRLSIGHLFHYISLEDDSITITSYRSRQDDEPIQLEYKFATRVPDSLSYSALQTLFTKEMTTTVNWSYLDNYLCTRGVSDSYGLMPSLKFWRSVFVLLPVFTDETKRLCNAVKERATDGCPLVHCDVYEADYLAIDPYPLCEKFLHFVEFINRVRRSSTATRKLARQSMVEKLEFSQRSRDIPLANAVTASEQPGLDQPMKLVPHTTITTSSPRCFTPQHALGISVPPSSSSAEASAVPAGPILPSVPTCSTVSPTASSAEQIGCARQFSGPSLHSPVLPSAKSTPAPLIITMMADVDIGLPFVTATSATVFPEHTFMSFDAVAWVIKWLSDVNVVPHAVAYLQTLLNDGWICHTSGNPSHTFIYGSYFYTLLPPDTKSLDMTTNPNCESAELSVHSTPVTPNPISFPGATVTASQSAAALVAPSLQTSGTSKIVDVSGIVNVPLASRPSSLNLRPRRFPEAFIPRSTAGSSGWTMDFQTDWAEVAFAHNAYEPASTVLSSASLRASDHDGGSVHPVDSTSMNTSYPEGFLTHSSLPFACGLSGKSGCYESEGVLRKTCVCDFDDPSTDGRVEWAHCVYDANYHSCCSFSIELQWMVASGARLSELVSIWRHRASANNFHFFPVPCYPFGHSKIRCDADPLRIPVFVPMNLTSLLQQTGLRTQETSNSTQSNLLDPNAIPTGSSLLHNESDPVTLASKLFPGYNRAQSLHILRSFQDYLLKRFGFLRHTYNPQETSLLEQKHEPSHTFPNSTRRWIYVHCSGGMFVMIPVYSTTPSSELKKAESYEDSSPHAFHSPQNPSVSESVRGSQHTMQLEYKNRKCGGGTEIGKDQHNVCLREKSDVGYFWAWNHMLPRRWRGHLTGDESFQDAMLNDFRSFMKSEDDRLISCYHKYLEDKVSRFCGSQKRSRSTV